jgi:phosphoglycolate phosphatase-like HAD superfamily hydrolase
MSRNTVDKGNFGSDGAIKAVIFDCDGVIVDSRAANASLYNQFLSHFNKEPLNEDQLNYVHCHTLQESLKFLLGDDRLIREAERVWQEMDYEPLIELLTLQPGLMECLELLRRHYKTAIATSRTRTMGQLLERFELNPYFDLVVTSLDGHTQNQSTRFFPILISRLMKHATLVILMLIGRRVNAQVYFLSLTAMKSLKQLIMSPILMN